MASTIHMATTTLRVEGMTCGACTSAVESAFQDMPGVGNVSVSLVTERCVIIHDPALASTELLQETIEDRGFDAQVLATDTVSDSSSTTLSSNQDAPHTALKPDLRRTTVSIEGMTCGACTSAVESGFHDFDGVRSFSISLLAERCVLVHDPVILPVEQIAETIEDRGFDAHIISSEPVEAVGAATATSEVHIKIYGIPDLTASDNLESLLTNSPGVKSASISLKTLRATVSFDSSVIGLRAIVQLIEGAGYNALLAETDDNNAQLESLAKTKEIQSWRRNFRVSLFFAIPVFLTSMFFPMFLPFLDYGSIRVPFIPGLWLGDLVCLVLTIPVQFGIGRRFYVSAGKSIKHGTPTMDVLVVLGTTAAFSFSIAAMCVSIFSTPHTRPATVFDTSTMLITFITFGRYLENSAKSQTSKALSRLMSLAPSTAAIYVDPLAAEKAAETSLIRLEKDSSLLAAPNASDSKGSSAEQQTVPTELIQIGDIVILKPGDKIPADGTVIRGQSYIDESMVTGEAMPVFKKVKSSLMAGTVNGAARLDFKVTRAGRDTQLSQIVRLVQEAQTNRAPIQRMADIVAGYFVPVIISLGVITFVGWMILSHVLTHPPQMFLDNASGGKVMVCLKLCISVIVFACPCALGLSTPTAVMVGTGVGAEKGILVKGGAALETATKITHVIFDKTGTLTTGKMSVAQVNWSEEWQQDKVQQLWWKAVGLAELSSEHPIGRTIVRAAREVVTGAAEGILDGSVDQFAVAVGQGISASITIAKGKTTSSHKVIIGNSAFLRSNEVTLPTIEEPADTTSSRFNDGTTLIYTAIDSSFAATIYLADELKPTAKAAIAALQRMGIPSSIVTGDAEPTALAIASTLHIPKANVHASASPSQKQALIRALQEAGETVAMVGDGINDSPALASADIGISLSTGTDVAMEAADIVLMLENDLLSVPAALHLARTIFNRIKLNLLWACGYNVIGLPFAMGILLPWGYSMHPMAAGAAMAFSSVSVVVSSLCLKFWRRPTWMDTAVLENWDGRNYHTRSARLTKGVPWWLGSFAWLRKLRRGSRAMAGEGRTGDDVVYVPLSNVDEV